MKKLEAIISFVIVIAVCFGVSIISAPDNTRWSTENISFCDGVDSMIFVVGYFLGNRIISYLLVFLFLSLVWFVSFYLLSLLFRKIRHPK